VKTRTSLKLPRLGTHTRAWLTCGGQPVLGDRHLAILETVGTCGSLNAAAQRLRMSYRDVWGKIRQAEAALGVELITARVGGAHGGGSRLTAAGEQVVARLRAFHQEHQQAVARSAALYFGAGTTPRVGRRNGERLLLATTTSVVDTGLLAALLPPFAKRLGVEVDVLPVGSGVALQLARAGRADVVLAHAPAAEEHSVAAGDTVNRRPVMTNEFVLVGPPDDPAGVRAAPDARTALRRIAAARAPWLGRGDRSGTSERERRLLAAAAVKPGAWYQRQRCGMADLLRRANVVGGYALTDGGTFAALADELSLAVLCSGDPLLANAYSVLATDPHRHAGANYLAAMALIGWLTSPAAQELIAAYRVGGRAVADPAAAGSVRRSRR
jgi:tungstate transport system substrate-binding protein